MKFSLGSIDTGESLRATPAAERCVNSDSSLKFLNVKPQSKCEHTPAIPIATMAESTEGQMANLHLDEVTGERVR